MKHERTTPIEAIRKQIAAMLAAAADAEIPGRVAVARKRISAALKVEQQAAAAFIGAGGSPVAAADLDAAKAEAKSARSAVMRINGEVAAATDAAVAELTALVAGLATVTADLAGAMRTIEAHRQNWAAPGLPTAWSQWASVDASARGLQALARMLGGAR